MKKIINTDLIINFMETNKLSKRQFCKLCKIDYSVLQKILNNKTNFRIGALFKISKILKIKPCKIFN